MARVEANPRFVDSVRLNVEAGIETVVDAYLPAIAFKLSPASGARTGRAYVVPSGSYQYASTSAVGEHEQTQDLFGETIGRIHIASAVGEPPALLTGTLRESAGVKRDDGATSVVAEVGPNAVNPDDGSFYGQELELEMGRPAWAATLDEEWVGLLFPAFAEGFAGSAP